MTCHMVIRMCDSKRRKKQDNAINKERKGEQNANVTVCTFFVFKDAYASMKGTIKFF